MLRILIGWDRAVARWVGDRLDIADFGPCTAIGIVNDAGLVAGAVYNNYRHPNIEVTFASATPRWCNKSIAFALVAYPFNQLSCARITSTTAASNAEARAFLEHCGYREEGRMRKAMPSGEDAIIYGLLPEESRWLKKGRANV